MRRHYVTIVGVENVGPNRIAQLRLSCGHIVAPDNGAQIRDIRNGRTSTPSGKPKRRHCSECVRAQRTAAVTTTCHHCGGPLPCEPRCCDEESPR